MTRDCPVDVQSASSLAKIWKGVVFDITRSVFAPENLLGPWCLSQRHTGVHGSGLWEVSDHWSRKIARLQCQGAGTARSVLGSLVVVPFPLPGKALHAAARLKQIGSFMSEAFTSEQARTVMASVEDPEIGRTLGDLDMIKEVTVEGEKVSVVIELPTPAYPDRDRISDAVGAALRGAHPEAACDVQWTSKVHGKHAGGNIGLNIANIIAVGSGKGGVGKSTVSAALAYGLLKSGARVGLLDADVYGPSIPLMVGVSEQPVIKQIQHEGRTIDRIVPLEADGLKVMSMGLMIPDDQAVIWRGPMLHKWLTQLLHQTEWGVLDYLVIDMPPGTGDVSLTLSQTVQLAGAVVVCTPQQVALLDAIKAISMFHQVKIPVLGMVENMSGEIFGRGGTKAKADELGIPFLGEIPTDAQIRIQGDAGRIAALFDEGSSARGPLQHVCERTAIQIAKNLLESPSMPTLEVL